VLAPFTSGDRLFITARGDESPISMWTTGSRSAGLYWCAAAIAKLWLPGKLALERVPQSGVRALLPLQSARTVA
jgi:hypothetical protein